jgi:hypothetical protein
VIGAPSTSPALAHVASILADRQRPDLSWAIAAGSLDVWEVDWEPAEDLRPLGDFFAAAYGGPVCRGRITVPESAYIHLTDTDSDWAIVRAAIEDGLPWLSYFDFVEGEGDLTHGVPATHEAVPCRWRGLDFRSQSERYIAGALDRANVLFFPNARGRVGVTADHRETREPDFLVVHDGKVAILEVDGPRGHVGRACEDHDRDRLFRDHGIRVVERFDSDECRTMPDDVVARFLRLVDSNG